jgi:hypothetical protein
MKTRLPALALALAAGWLLLQGAWALSQPPFQQFPPGQVPPIQNPQPKAPARVQPKLEPFAETKLLMEGLAQANFRGVEKLLNQQPTDNQAWVFARGQALLLAETGNLLMLRPPRNDGEPTWFQRSADYRNWAVYLAQCLAIKDYERSRAALTGLANTCNRCHQTFRVRVQIRAFEDQPKVSY